MFQVCKTETKEKCREEEVEQCELETEQVGQGFFLYLLACLKIFWIRKKGGKLFLAFLIFQLWLQPSVPGVRDRPRGSVRPRYRGELSDFCHPYVYYSARPGKTTHEVWWKILAFCFSNLLVWRNINILSSSSVPRPLTARLWTRKSAAWLIRKYVTTKSTLRARRISRNYLESRSPNGVGGGRCIVGKTMSLWTWRLAGRGGLCW